MTADATNAVFDDLMRTEDGRWTCRHDRALRSPVALRMRDPETMWRFCANIDAPTLIVRGSCPTSSLRRSRSG